MRHSTLGLVTRGVVIWLNLGRGRRCLLRACGRRYLTRPCGILSGTKEDVSMSKGQKRSPPSLPALTDQDTAHLKWIQRNGTELARSALALYRKHGRGAFIVKEKD